MCHCSFTAIGLMKVSSTATERWQTDCGGSGSLGQQTAAPPPLPHLCCVRNGQSNEVCPLQGQKESSWLRFGWLGRLLPVPSDLVPVTIYKQVMQCLKTGGWWDFQYVREMCNVLALCYCSWHSAKPNYTMCPCVSMWPGNYPEGARMPSVGQQFACLRKKSRQNCVFTSLSIHSSL